MKLSDMAQKYFDDKYIEELMSELEYTREQVLEYLGEDTLRLQQEYEKECLAKAAPDMLEWIESIVINEFDFGDKREDYEHEQIWEIVQSAKALIKKAKGES